MHLLPHPLFYRTCSARVIFSEILVAIIAISVVASLLATRGADEQKEVDELKE
jgi:hypothetical protein